MLEVTCTNSDAKVARAASEEQKDKSTDAEDGNEIKTQRENELEMIQTIL